MQAEFMYIPDDCVTGDVAGYTPTELGPYKEFRRILSVNNPKWNEIQQRDRPTQLIQYPISDSFCRGFNDSSLKRKYPSNKNMTTAKIWLVRNFGESYDCLAPVRYLRSE